MSKKRKQQAKLPTSGHRRVEEVYLVQPPIGGGPHDIAPPLGILVLAAALEREGCNPHVIDFNLRDKRGELDTRRSLRNQFVQALPKRSSAIDLIGVSCWSYNFDIGMEFVEALRKKHPHVPIVVGGPHTTFVDEETLRQFDSVDYIVRDEADLTFPQLVAALREGADPAALAQIPGLTWRREGEIVRNPSGGVVEDMDALPYPAYHLVDTKAYVALCPVIAVEAGRGCPYNCNFCSTSNMFQKKYRVKSPARLIDEVEWTMRLTGTNRFEFAHDNLVANKKYVRALCAEIRERNIDVEWSCTSRPDNLTEELAQEMFLAGCAAIFFGIETLSAERQKWTGKGLKPPKVHAAIEMTRRQHVQPNLGIIIGFPDESEEEFDDTVRAAIRWTVDQRAGVSTAILRYYPGADLFAKHDELRFDALAAHDASSLRGYQIRPEWRELVQLFPLQAIHTQPTETRRNVIRRDLIRTLLKLAPLTLRALVDVCGCRPRRLLDRLSDSAAFLFVDRRDDVLMWNEILSAFSKEVCAQDSEPLLELLTTEVPFFRTSAIVAPMQELEHLIQPKRWEQDSLLAWARGDVAEPEATLEGTSVLAIRAGPEAVVWFTPNAQEMLEVFLESFADDRQGTIDYVNSLRRGVLQ